MTIKKLEDPWTKGLLGQEWFNKLLESPGVPTYPPYDIVALGDNEYEIQIAVAGFAREDLKVALDKRVLIISGEKIETSDCPLTYIHKGIATRKFKREFKLANDVYVDSVELEDGMLVINLKKDVDEEETPFEFVIT